jgi:hypothetical protein
MRSCLDWHGAIGKEPSRDLSVVIYSIPALDRLVASPLHRHVAEVDARPYIYEDLSLDEFRRLRSLPRLTSLQCSFLISDLLPELDDHDPHPDHSRDQLAQAMRDALPPLLRSLTIALATSHDDYQIPFRQALLDALPSLAQLSHLDLADDEGDTADLSPLLRLPLLRHLKLPGDLSPEERAVVKQLPLVSLDGHWTAPISDEESLLDLLTPPHRLQRLEQIDLRDHYIAPQAMAALLQLPALTELQPAAIRPDCWGGLRDFTQLRVLQLDSSSSHTAEQLAALGESLSALPHLADLRMRFSSQVARDHDPPLAMHLPALRTLSLNYAPIPPQSFVQHSPLLQSLHLSVAPVPSLGFLQHTPLLEELRLLSCTGLAGAGEAVVESLRTYPSLHLRTLVLQNCRIDLSGAQRTSLQPRSALLPALRSFQYSEPAAAASRCRVM